MPQTKIRGTVSQGTMIVDDLIPKFIEVLEKVDPEKAEGFEEELAEAGKNEEGKRWVLSGLFLALDDIAPEGYYFGAHSGDGADFGFWKCDDSDPFFPEGDDITEAAGRSASGWKRKEKNPGSPD